MLEKWSLVRYLHVCPRSVTFSSVYLVAQENLMKARDERIALMNEVR